MKIDGFARVITDADGNIIYVIDNHFDNDNLHSSIGSTEIIDAICELTSKDAEVLIPISYHYSPSTYSNGYYSDPEEIFETQGEFVLCENHKQTMVTRIQKYIESSDIDDSLDTQYRNCWGEQSNSVKANFEIEYFEEIYKEKYASK